ncbi:MAG: DUF4145 domain-containing protein [Halomonas sp.]|nr:DUF4145 domain-containing protein [Halomonas sp.]
MLIFFYACAKADALFAFFIFRMVCMDRVACKSTFGKAGVTAFYCPSCGKGRLKVKQGSLSHSETSYSKRSHSHEAFDFDWVEYIFSCILECANSNCKEVVATTGSGGVEQYYTQDENGEHDVDYDEFFKPMFFYPHLKIFELPSKTPASVSNEINISFSLIFSDPSSSANHIRIALENLLSELKIRRFKTSNGKRKYLNLHQRIDSLPEKYEHVKDLFYAVKWLGNAGSHSHQELTFDDVFDAYEIISQILEEVYDDRKKKVASLAKKINKRKGPR